MQRSGPRSATVTSPRTLWISASHRFWDCMKKGTHPFSHIFIGCLYPKGIQIMYLRSARDTISWPDHRNNDSIGFGQQGLIWMGHFSCSEGIWADKRDALLVQRVYRRAQNSTNHHFWVLYATTWGFLIDQRIILFQPENFFGRPETTGDLGTNL